MAKMNTPRFKPAPKTRILPVMPVKPIKPIGVTVSKMKPLQTTAPMKSGLAPKLKPNSRRMAPVKLRRGKMPRFA